MGSNSISSGEGSYPSKYMLSISLIIRHSFHAKYYPPLKYLLIIRYLRQLDLRRGESYHQDEFPESPKTEYDNAEDLMVHNSVSKF